MDRQSLQRALQYFICSFSSDHSMTIFARELIRAGEPIYHCYTPVLNPTNIRRLMLFTGKNFSCECDRCKDPAEMGAFTSALKCSDCPGGTILPENPIDLASTWRCTKCSGGTRAGGDVAMLERYSLSVITGFLYWNVFFCSFRRVSMEIQGLDSKDIAGMESLLAQYSEVFDPRHALMLKVKQMLSVGYGRFDCTMQTLKEEKLKRKVELCREVVAGLKILETGIAARRGKHKESCGQYELIAFLW